MRYRSFTIRHRTALGLIVVAVPIRTVSVTPVSRLRTLTLPDARRQTLRGESDPLVGLWWNHDHDPLALTCPRGGIPLKAPPWSSSGQGTFSAFPAEAGPARQGDRRGCRRVRPPRSDRLNLWPAKASIRQSRPGPQELLPSHRTKVIGRGEFLHQALPAQSPTQPVRSPARGPAPACPKDEERQPRGWRSDFDLVRLGSRVTRLQLWRPASEAQPAPPMLPRSGSCLRGRPGR